MNMDIPGLSIFQGGENLKLDTSATRLEEEEALEDQKRRNEELREQLQNAFDDLIDDDDCTMDTSANFESRIQNGNCVNDNFIIGTEQNVVNNGNLRYENGDFPNVNIEIAKLYKVIESKDREIENISKMVHDERKKNDELQKRLALSEAEKERAFVTRKQTHELLVESKANISELESSILELKSKIKTLENNNNELVGELEKTKTLLSDAQHKYYLVEKNAGFTADRNNDHVIQQLKERNSAQMEMMQQQIDNFTRKLDDKEQEYKTLETRYKEIQKSREALLIEKTDTINQLAKNLEESQKHCQQLMLKEDFSQENLRLHRVINAFEEQTENMRKTIDELQSRLNATTSELKLMESLICENGGEISENFRRLNFGKEDAVGSTPVPNTDRLTRLKTELYRSMADQQSKRDEIRRLQEQLNSKIEEINKLKDDENKALVQMNIYRESNTRLENRIRILESEIDEMKKEICDGKVKSFENDKEQDIRKLEHRNNLLEQELKNTKKEHSIIKDHSEALKLEIENLRKKIKSTTDQSGDLKKMNSSLKNLNVDLEELKQENESLKNKYNALVKENVNLEENANSTKIDLEKHKFLLTDAKNECDRLKNLYAEISNAKDVLSKQLAEFKANDLNKELYVQKEKCAILERALQLAEMKCSELEKSIRTHRETHEKELHEQRQKFENEKANILKLAKNTSNECMKCLDHIAEVTKFEIQNLKLQDQCTIYVKELNELRLELQDARHTILDLNEKVSLKQERDKLIDELKAKAQQFEEYIKTQNTSKETSGISSPKRTLSRDQSVETSPDLELNYNNRKIESKLREEMAKIFATEIKNIEENFKANLKELQNQNSTLSAELQRTSYELQLRQNEVEVLKHAILAEREKMKEILEEKESEYNQMYKKHTLILEKCRDELRIKQNQVHELLKELEERTSQIEAERKSMKLITQHWEEERKISDVRQKELKRRMAEKEQEHKKFVEQLQAKYLSAKKTAANYKRYSEDKEKHMLEEYDRIKLGYESSVAKIENKMHDILQRKNNEMKEKINEIETKCEAKLSHLKTEIDQAKLS